MKFSIHGAGGADGSTNEIDISFPYDLILCVGDKRYRFDFDKEGSLKIALINGVHADIVSVNGYPGIKLSHQ